MESSSFLGSSKRAKAPANIGQVAHCLVDGCDADLSLCRDYHRRHKVCEAHSKTPKVTIGGREQRFCQQCSRFHSLVEFDEGKRSCRKRLDGHNRRRRKPQAAECMSSRNSALVFSSQHQLHGGRLVSFSSSPQIVPTAVLSSSWGGDEIMQLYNPHQQQQLNYIDRQNSPFPDHCQAPPSYKLVNQLHLLQATSATATAMQDESNHKMFSIANDGSSDHRALSLLSPPPPPPTTHDPLHYSHYPPFAAHQTKPPPPATDSSALHIFQEGSSSHHQTLTFTWE